MEVQDYYGVLGVGIGAGEKEIKSAYRRLAKQTHPDLAPVGQKQIAEDQFKVVAEAYYVLSDKFRRCEYDLSRKVDGEGSRFKVQGSGKVKGQSSKVKRQGYTYQVDINADDLMDEILKVAYKEYQRVDRTTYVVRFGCGGFLGFFVGMWFGLWIIPYESRSFVFSLLVGIGMFGFLSAVYGDKFWIFLLSFGDLNWRRWK